MFDGFVGKLNRISAVVANTVKQLRKFFIELLKKNVGGVSIGKCNSQITAVNIHPMLERKCVCHFETIFRGVEHEPFVSVSSDGFYAVLHGEMYVRTTNKF